MLRDLVPQALPVPPAAGCLDAPQVVLQLALADRAALIGLIRSYKCEGGFSAWARDLSQHIRQGHGNVLFGVCYSPLYIRVDIQ